MTSDEPQLCPHAIRALELFQWRPLPESPGNIYVAHYEHHILLVHRKDDKFVGFLNGELLVATATPRQTMSALSILAERLIP